MRRTSGKNRALGKKLLITGRGRCNITQAEFDDQKFVGKLNDKKGKFLFSSLAAFGPEEVVDFFEKRGLGTKTEKNGKIFPVADESRDVLDVLAVLAGYLKDNGVKIIYGAEISGFAVRDGKINSVKLKDREIAAESFILATGGKSYPATGSTGDGYRWAEDFGHKIIRPLPALVPVRTKEFWPRDLQGLSLQDVALSVWQDNKKQEERFGEMLFTHFGISGPIVLDAIRKISALLLSGEVKIYVDLFPAIKIDELDKKLQDNFTRNNNKNFRNYLSDLLPKKMADTISSLIGIEAERKLNFVTREERLRLAQLLKKLSLIAEETTGYNQAIVTAGGIDLKEIDSKKMRSKIISNLFLPARSLIWMARPVDIISKFAGVPAMRLEHMRPKNKILLVAGIWRRMEA